MLWRPTPGAGMGDSGPLAGAQGGRGGGDRNRAAPSSSRNWRAVQEVDTGADGPLPPASPGARPAAGARRPACPCLPSLALSQDLQTPKHTSGLPAAPYGPQRQSSPRLSRRAPGELLPQPPAPSLPPAESAEGVDPPGSRAPSPRWAKPLWEGRGRLPVGLELGLGLGLGLRGMGGWWGWLERCGVGLRWRWARRMRPQGERRLRRLCGAIGSPQEGRRMRLRPFLVGSARGQVDVAPT